jgi:ABC-type antimicrobial peptide transport system permease subunit
MDRLLARITETEGVRSVAAVFPHPFRDVGPTAVTVEGVSAIGPSHDAVFYTVSAGYFETMRLRVLGGRSIRVLDNENAPLVAVVSEGLARSISSTGDVLGRRIRVGDETQPWRTIVGVANDTKKSFTASPAFDVYVPYAQNPRAYQSIVVRTDGDVAGIVEPVRRAVAALDPVLALSDVEPLDDVVARQGSQRRGMTLLLGAFSLFALALSALGLYSSLSYTVVQRRPELALRMAVGADASAVLRLILSEGLRTAGIGLAVGAVSSAALGRVLESQLYGVSSGDPVTLAFISVVLGATTLASCLVPGRRAAKTDPAMALRE